jgi:Tfp pilus assembly protein PilZ
VSESGATPGPQLVLRFEDRTALRDEYEQNLAHGRALVRGAGGLQLFSPCTLVLELADSSTQLALACEVVMLIDASASADDSDRAPQRGGLALQFVDRSAAALARVREFVLAACAADAEDEGTQPAAEHDAEYDPAEDRDLAADQRAIVQARAAKLRNLTPAQRMQVARGSVQEERVLLERLYGSAVWELLLRNPKITLPEVARMARKGTMPRPLLDVIAENEQWIRHSLVRRALLANPRLGPDAINRVLRTLPPRELKLVPQQTAYPQSVRQAATRLMRGS